MTAAEAKETAARASVDSTISLIHRTRARELVGLALGAGLTIDESIALVAARLAEWARADAFDAGDALGR